MVIAQNLTTDSTFSIKKGFLAANTKYIRLSSVSVNSSNSGAPTFNDNLEVKANFLNNTDKVLVIIPILGTINSVIFFNPQTIFPVDGSSLSNGIEFSFSNNLDGIGGTVNMSLGFTFECYQ